MYQGTSGLRRRTSPLAEPYSSKPLMGGVKSASWDETAGMRSVFPFSGVRASTDYPTSAPGVIVCLSHSWQPTNNRKDAENSTTASLRTSMRMLRKDVNRAAPETYPRPLESRALRIRVRFRHRHKIASQPTERLQRGQNRRQPKGAPRARPRLRTHNPKPGRVSLALSNISHEYSSAPLLQGLRASRQSTSGVGARSSLIPEVRPASVDTTE
jgi:hypothetical protein